MPAQPANDGCGEAGIQDPRSGRAAEIQSFGQHARACVRATGIASNRLPPLPTRDDSPSSHSAPALHSTVLWTETAPINAVVRGRRDQGRGLPRYTEPQQSLGGPALANAGSMVLRDVAGLVVDSLNYGGLIDPWVAEGYPGAGPEQGGVAVARLVPARAVVLADEVVAGRQRRPSEYGPLPRRRRHRQQLRRFPVADRHHSGGQFRCRDEQYQSCQCSRLVARRRLMPRGANREMAVAAARQAPPRCALTRAWVQP